MSNLIAQWNERVAFNQGYEAQKIAQANSAGRDAFSAGLDKSVARASYLSSEDGSVDIQPVGEVLDGEDTLGMESVVDSETEYSMMDEALSDMHSGEYDQYEIGGLYESLDTRTSSCDFDDRIASGDWEPEQDDNGQYYVSFS